MGARRVLPQTAFFFLFSLSTQRKESGALHSDRGRSLSISRHCFLWYVPDRQSFFLYNPTILGYNNNASEGRLTGIVRRWNCYLEWALHAVPLPQKGI